MIEKNIIGFSISDVGDSYTQGFNPNINFGVEQAEILDSMHCFAEEVMPHFTAAAERTKPKAA